MTMPQPPRQQYGYPGAQPPTSAPTAHTLTLKPTQFGLIAAIAVGVVVLIKIARPFIWEATYAFMSNLGASAIVTTVLTVLTLLCAIAATVFGVLGFVRSGRRDAVAFGAAMVGAVEIVAIVFSFASQALFSLF